MTEEISESSGPSSRSLLPTTWTTLPLDAPDWVVPVGVAAFTGLKPYFSTGSIRGSARVPEGVFGFPNRPTRANRIGRKWDVLQARMEGASKALIVTESLDNSLFSTGFMQWRPPFAPETLGPWLFYAVQTPDFLDQRDRLASGTTQVALSDRNLSKITVPIAPLAEQRRIVEAIETRFERLDAAVRVLERARVNLKRYRASVLEAACSGRLVRTEASLARGNGTNYEPATALVARLSEERRRARAELGSRRGLINVSDVTLPSEPLPEGWRWYLWEELAARITVGYVGPISTQHSEVGVPLVRSQNVRPNRFEPKGMSHVPHEFYLANRKCGVSGGDICVVRSGDVGVACVIPRGLGEALCSDLVIIQRPICVIPQYGSYVMNSVARQRVLRGKVGIGLSHYNTKSVAALPIPVPPMAEQERIVGEVEGRLSAVDAASLEVERGLFRCVRLRNSVLNSAFEGRLVPQDPNDESASALLERIKQVCQTTSAPAHRIREAGSPT